MDNILNVQGAPHVRDSISTRKIMLDVIIALVPATVWGIIQFGMNTAIIVLSCIITCVLSESIFNLVVGKRNTVGDLSCVVTAMILALNMPPEVPFYIPVIGSIFAIVIVKMLFGGLGQNFMNPALAGRCFCLISFAGPMSDFSSKLAVDEYTSATPLVLLRNGNEVDLLEMFFGFRPGVIGEVSIICLLIGVIYLIVKKVVDFHIPMLYILSFAVFIIIFSGRPTDANYILGEIMGGGLIFGAFFMANDYATSPCTPLGKTIYAIFLGVLTGIFRLFGKNAECISFVILMGNIITPLLESFTIPRAFGKEGK